MSVRGTSPSHSSSHSPIQEFNSSSVEDEDSLELPEHESFADSTYLKINDHSVKLFRELQKSMSAPMIYSWIGGDKTQGILHQTTKRISVKDARLVNEYSGTTIFELDEKDVIELKISDSARNTLQKLNGNGSNFSQASVELGFQHYFLSRIKNGRSSSISKTTAQKIDEYFNTDVFRIHQIFIWASAESIHDAVMRGNINNSDEFTIIKFDRKSQNAVKNLEPSTRLEISKIIGTTLQNYYATISIKNAVVVNQISGLKILNFLS